MSHNWGLRCECGVSHSSQYNNCRTELVEAVKEAFPLYLLSKTKWGQNLWSINFESSRTLEQLAPFIVYHYDHGGFYVVGEYSNDQEERVLPDAPNYSGLVLDHLKLAITDLERRLELLKGDVPGT